MIFLGGTSGFHYGQVILQIHLSVGQVDFLTKFAPGFIPLLCVVTPSIWTRFTKFMDWHASFPRIGMSSVSVTKNLVSFCIRTSYSQFDNSDRFNLHVSECSQDRLSLH